MVGRPSSSIRAAALQAIAASSAAAEKMREQFAPILSALENYVRTVREEAEGAPAGSRLRAIDRTLPRP